MSCAFPYRRSRVVRVAMGAAVFLNPVVLFAGPRVQAQLGGVVSSANSAAATIPELIAGQVVNAVTGVPLPRTLVQISGRAVFTDQEGRFRFEQPGQPVSALKLTKPGFSMTPEQQMDGSSEGVLPEGDPASLTMILWPEGLLVGTVKAADGEPLPRVSILVRRSLFDDQGRHFQIAGQRQTDAHGEFRLPVPAGDYRVETQFSPRSFDRAQAILPYVYPQLSSSTTTGVFHVGSGEEQHLELRPATSKTHVVTLPLEAGDEGQPPQITARTADGTSFGVNASRSQDPGSLRMDLPSGTYSLRAMRYSREGMQFGESSVTVGDHDIPGPALHLNPLPNIPVEMILDASISQGQSSGGGRPPDTAPSVMQFNLALQPVDVDPTSPFQFGVRPTQQRDSGVTLAAPPGLYRLTANIAGGWYIRSATSRGTDLLRENLVISPGSSPSPITLIVSNQMGSVQGTVKLAGSPANCWLFLLATGPALPAVMIGRSDASGRFHVSLPPGSYRAIAFPYRHSANLQDSAVLNRFATHVGGVTVSAGSTSNLDLDAVPVKELAP